MVHNIYSYAKNLRHVSPQNRFTLKEFETTTREIALIIFPIYETLQRRENKVITILYDRFFIYRTVKSYHLKKIKKSYEK